MASIAEWLASIGLGEYASRFRENAIDLSVVRDLTEQDLKDLGVLLGHRRKMLRAILELQGEGARTPRTVTKLASANNAGRRQLTVMFCDLVGSSALSARLDLEDLRAVMGAYHRCIAEVVAQNEGVIARYMGDGVLAYFGYPQAHEDDAEQAARAGLALVDAVAQLRTEPATQLQIRVGIATGMVVVGDLTGEGAAQEQAVIGETPNLAARLQTFANPGTVLISESTHRLTDGHFVCRNIGPVALKGWAELIPAWQVLGTTEVDSRFEAQHKTRLAPPIGRDEEIEMLLRRWQHARHGEGCAVMLIGEPGIGKSHIALALDERLHAQPPPARLKGAHRSHAPKTASAKLVLKRSQMANRLQITQVRTPDGAHEFAVKSCCTKAFILLHRGRDLAEGQPTICRASSLGRNATIKTRRDVFVEQLRRRRIGGIAPY
jgi:class 3 adenylate cyclase